MIKKYILLVFSLFTLLACKEEASYTANTFPGYTGAGDQAVWVVYTNAFTDPAYVTSYLSKLVPPMTLSAYDATYVAARQKEVSPYSYKLFKSGEVALIGKSAANESIWIKKTDYKWEDNGTNLMISQNVAGTWVNVIVGYPDQDKLLLRYKKAYFGNTTTEKDRYVMEVLYSMFK